MKNKLLISLMILSWSVYFVLCDFLVKEIGSPFVAGLLLRIGTFFVLSLYLLLTRKFYFSKIRKKNLLQIITTGVFAFTYDLLINIGLKYSTASSGTALLKTELFFVLFYEIVFEKKVIKFQHISASIIMIVGAFMTVCGDKRGNIFDVWSLIFVISALLNTVCAFVLKKIQIDDGPGGCQIAYINNIVSMILYFVLSIFDCGSVLLLPIENVNLLSLVICIFCQATLMITYYSLLGTYSVWKVKALLLLIPILTLLLQLVIYHYFISVIECTGILLIILGGFFLLYFERKKQ